MNTLTNQQRLNLLSAVQNLIFEVESSYPYNWNDPHPPRQQLYRMRIDLGYVEQRIKDEIELEIEAEYEALRD